MSKTSIIKLLIAASIASWSASGFSDDAKQNEREEMYKKYLEFPSYVKGGQVEPHWMADGNSFWYAEGAPENTTFWVVDPEANTKEPLLDVAKLRAVLRNELGQEPQSKGIPFDEFTFTDKRQNRIQFNLDGQKFELRLPSYDIKNITPAAISTTSRGTEEANRPDTREVASPGGNWFAGVKDHNLYLRTAESDDLVWLTQDGVEQHAWAEPAWSPDGEKLVASRYDDRQMPKIPVVDYLSARPDVEWVDYPDFVDAVEPMEMYIFDAHTKKRVKVAGGVSPYTLIRFLRWKKDGTEVLLLEASRYRRYVRFAAANSMTGAVREIVGENYGVPDFGGLPITLLNDGKQFIWHWDRDGWKHLYLYDLSGKLVCQLTQGDYPVDRVLTLDEQRGWVYFIARTDRSRPYDTHLCRVNLKGKRFQQLTEATGQHGYRNFSGENIAPIYVSPSKKYFLDSHSSVNRLPSVELRSVEGRLLQTLVKSDANDLKKVNWKPPEEFAVMAADEKTHLHGLIYKPHDFDPSRKYPVIQNLGRVPRSFLGRPNKYNVHSVCQAMSQLGFVVFVVDRRGPWARGRRGREFEEVTWGTFGRHEIPDYVAALQDLAKSRPYMDLTRVGVTGGSMNGYFAVRAMLQAPETYHVGVAIAPVIDVASHPNHYWLGAMSGNKQEYEFSSSLRLANRLEGKLMLIHGTADRAVPIGHTMRLADAFIQASKTFDMLVIPGWGHWGNERVERYWTDRTSRYFIEHLKPYRVD